jgi:general secretion pathway protein G
MTTFRFLLGLVVFCAAGLLVLAVIVPKRGHGPARETAALVQLSTMSQALNAFRIDAGSYPEGSNGLIDLVRRPPGVTNWRGPYLQQTNLPLDPWAQEFIYRCPGQHTAEGYPYDLFSLGPPGQHKPIENWADPALKPRYWFSPTNRGTE